ncbi:MAG: glycoside hydrolase family 97 protein [Chloroflexi bacterium]|nr:glycoside hydrolase family 97 protein [Chloroflexota bacterium]
MSRKQILKSLIIFLLPILLVQCRSSITLDAQERVSSPDGKIEVTFLLENGVPYYKIDRAEQPVILQSKLGFTFAEAAPLDQNLSIVNVETSTFDETWTQPWGEVKEIREHYNELRIELIETTPDPRKMNVVFRVFDDGVGFRYEWPEQEHLSDFEITDEETEFALAGDHQAWWIPAFWENRYEYLYRNTPISEIASDLVSAVHTPLTLQTSAGLYITIHEAALKDYSSMALAIGENYTLKCELYPWSDGSKVKASTPHQTPWRTIQIAENAGDLITSYLILNLNEPNQLEDVSWIRPGKYVGIWWGMHIGEYTWGSGPNHGATTENAKRYIDFAAENGFDGVLIEGWNQGWDGDWTAHGNKFSFTEPYPDFDLAAVAAYAAEQGVKLIGHHETGAAIQNCESQMEDAFALYQSLGVDTVKTGYVGWGQGIKRRNENGHLRGLEWHHGQFMVEHYRRVIETAAKYHIMLDVHEPIKDTGERRTYPNMMTREGARGQEYDAWSDDGGNPPEHTTILPFTRMMAGPFDMTPGTFDLMIAEKPNNRVNTTLAKQLALYVVIYSPLHMASDLPENYEGQPAFQFIQDVPTDWQDTQVLHAQIGDFVTIVRQEREGADWYLGSITDEEARTLDAPLSFLEPGQQYVAEIYADGAGADWESNPLSIDIRQVLVDSETVLTLQLAPGGGTAIRFRPATLDEVEDTPTYQP